MPLDIRRKILCRNANAHLPQSGLLNFQLSRHRRTAHWASVRTSPHCQSQHNVASLLKWKPGISSTDRSTFSIRARSSFPYPGALSAYISSHRTQQEEIKTSSHTTMISQFKVVIELPEGSCYPQVLEQILAQVNKFFDRLSNGLRESTGLRLRVTWVYKTAAKSKTSADVLAFNRIGPWEAQHPRWAGEFSIDAPQSLLNNGCAQTALPLESLVKHAALGSSPVQPGGVHRLVFYIYSCCWVRLIAPVWSSNKDKEGNSLEKRAMSSTSTRRKARIPKISISSSRKCSNLNFTKFWSKSLHFRSQRPRLRNTFRLLVLPI